MAYWIINSYGYPNPFSDNSKAREAWDVLLSFKKFKAYSLLRQDWENQGKNTSGIESWKAAFEEFGFLYVLTRSDEIVITDAGEQIIKAANAQNKELFIWIGLNLMLRYPLKGPPRARPKGEKEQQNSDLLPYAFLLAAMKDLGYLWRAEIDHIISRVFKAKDVNQAISNIQKLRSGEIKLSQFPFSENPRKGSFYNILNQIIIHSSLGFELFDKDTQEVFYQSDSLEYRYTFNNEWTNLIDKALGGNVKHECFSSNSFISRMPTSINFANETEYFKYLGSTVTNIPVTNPILHSYDLGGSEAFILKDTKHYSLVSKNEIEGSIEQLCQIPTSQRVILSHDLTKSFIVTDKKRKENSIILIIRPAKPISKFHITQLLDGYLS